MLYPGQLVYAPEEKKVGIYVAYDPDVKARQEPTLYVYLFIGEKGEHSDTCIYAPKELVPVTIPDKKSLTGQSLYVTDFQRAKFSHWFSDKEVESHETVFLEELAKVQNLKWFKQKYEIDNSHVAPLIDSPTD